MGVAYLAEITVSDSEPRSFSEQIKDSVAFPQLQVSTCPTGTSNNRPRRLDKLMYRVSDGVRSTHGQDGAIVLDVQQGQMFNLNRVGSRILELLENGSAEPDVVTIISREFNVSQEVVENDLREFMGALKRHKLVSDR